MLNIYKPQGLTPKEVLDSLRLKRSDLIEEPLSYAGRLDPLAEGVLPILVGREENKRREKYLKMDKKYQARFVFGFSTDTGDIMGLIKEKNFDNSLSKFDFEKTKKLIDNLPGEYIQDYPQYSSPYIANTSPQPKKRIIYSSKLKDNGLIPTEKLKKEASEIIKKVKGDFRQRDIIENHKNIPDNLALPWIILELEVSSGFYLRALTEDLKSILNYPSIVWPIKRIQAGDLKIEDSIIL